MQNIFAACFSAKKIQWHDEEAVSERSVTYQCTVILTWTLHTSFFGTLCHNTVDMYKDTIDFLEDDILQKINRSCFPNILYQNFPENQKKSLINKSFNNVSH